MLILNRGEKQQIVIADNIVVTVVQIGQRRVVLGIEAPPDVTVLRGELRRREGREYESPGRN